MEPLALDESAPAGRWPVERGLGVVARLALIALGSVVTISVVSRALGDNVIPDDVLVVSELMLVVILAPLPLVTAMREHIVVTIFTERLGAASLRLLNVLGHAAGAIFFSVLTWAFAVMLAGSWETGEYYEGFLRIPHWIGHAFATAALALVAGRLLMLLVTDVTRRTG